jgi:hypothetical protein
LVTLNKTLAVVVTLGGELQESEEQRGEVGVVHVLLAGGAVRPDAEALGLRVALEGVQVENSAGVDSIESVRANLSLYLRPYRYGFKTTYKIYLYEYLFIYEVLGVNLSHISG